MKSRSGNQMRDNSYFVETQGITRRREISAKRIPTNKIAITNKKEYANILMEKKKNNIVYTRDKRGRQDKTGFSKQTRIF